MSQAYNLFKEQMEEDSARRSHARQLANHPTTRRLVLRLERECVTSLRFWNWGRGNLEILAEKSITEWSEMLPLLEELTEAGFDFTSVDRPDEGIVRVFSAELNLGDGDEVQVRIKAIIPEDQSKGCRRVLVRHEYGSPSPGWPVYELRCQGENE